MNSKQIMTYILLMTFIFITFVACTAPASNKLEPIANQSVDQTTTAPAEINALANADSNTASESNSAVESQDQSVTQAEVEGSLSDSPDRVAAQSSSNSDDLSPETTEGDGTNQASGIPTTVPDGFIEPDPPLTEDLLSGVLPAPALMPVELLSGQLQPGVIKLSVTTSRYQPNQAIVIIVANGLDRPIYARDLKSDCTIMTLEGLVNEVWQPLANCSLERMSFAAVLEPGKGYQISLNLPDDTGTYRVSLTYNFDSRPDSPETEMAYSDMFQINP